jgi:hypothetical protein
MKKRLIGAALASVPAVAAMAASGSCALTCPYGNVNDPYPGLCPRYTDLNGDGICDLSQATAVVANTNTSSTSQNDQASTSAGNHSDGANASATITDPSDPGGNQLFGDDFHIIPISILLIGGYLFTHYLFSKGILNRRKHRRIWNILVTAGYAGTGVTGVLMILVINLGIKTALNPTLTFWHAELATLMVIVTLIHIHLHWHAFKHMFKVLFNLKPGRDRDKSEKRAKKPLNMNK